MQEGINVMEELLLVSRNRFTTLQQKTKENVELANINTNNLLNFIFFTLEKSALVNFSTVLSKPLFGSVQYHLSFTSPRQHAVQTPRCESALSTPI